MRKHLSNVHKLKNVELKNSFKKITGKAASSSSSQSFGNNSAASNLLASVAKSSSSSWLAGCGAVASSASSSPGSSSKLAQSPPSLSGAWSSPKLEENQSSQSPTYPGSGEAINLAKGNNLASIVSKLMK